MDDSTEAIRLQMEETRNSLQGKLESLEQQVKDTVQEATDTVTTVKETVEVVKETMQETASTVKETVHDTVDTVKESVADTVQSVKETLNLRHQVEEHPWAMVAGAVAVGFIGGRWLINMTGPPTGSVAAAMSTPTPPVSPQRTERPQGSQHNGHGTKKKAAAAAPISQGPSWWSLIHDHFGGEIDKLKGLAIGAAGSVVREMLTTSAPPPLADRLKEVVDSMTEKLGGQRLEGSILDFGASGSHDPVGATAKDDHGDLGRFDRRN